MDRSVLDGERCDNAVAAQLLAYARDSSQTAGVVVWADPDDPGLAGTLTGYRGLPDVLVREGERHRDFFVVLAGTVAIFEGYSTAEERLVKVHGPGRFLDELGLLTGPRAARPSPNSTSSSSAPARPGSPPPSTAPRKD
ncbi:cyclic nucleotide-binding domain-containing protein [Phytohabitans rumicis]|uniref:cyclic nucleotide-binding domain-containing protein n=1 Tax=Phytohabitans rumicis TaxID=1076125 RepID=UPI0031E73051